MAKNAFQELLETVADENDRKAITELADKYPEWKDGRLRQSDYSRSMNALSEEKKKIESDLNQLESWRTWRKDNWVDTGDGTGMTTSELEKTRQLEELNTEIEALRAAQEAGMTFEEVGQFIEKELTKRGVATRDYVEKELKPKLVDREFYTKDSLEKTNLLANGMQHIYDETFPLGFAHKDEFGEILKPSELLKFANENGFKDLGKAYESWVAPKRQEIQKKKTDELIAKAKEEGKSEALKEAGMGQNGRMPVDNKPPVMSHLQQRLRLPKDQQEKDPVPEDAQLGKGGAVASAVTQQYYKDLAEGTVLKG